MRRTAAWIAKSIVAIVSVAMLAVTAYAWTTYRDATDNLATDDGGVARPLVVLSPAG
ncbi:hypothetical protein ACFQ1S_30035 [Kibdelosporangium lantanae]|uniref:Uncharacterized protein n=1 Tax=Kibdelosporangium lantanae TaxID=1497396 RepID=A0ABW3MFT2_9PSEU